jgi:hypothetical protein
MINSRSLRALATLLCVVTLTAPAFAVSPASGGLESVKAASAGNVSSCAPLAFVGARGSGQASGYGDEVGHVFDAMNENLPDGTLDGEAIDAPRYPAEPVEDLIPTKRELALMAVKNPRGMKDYLANGYGKYMDSIAAGANAVYNELVDRAAKCPRQQFVVVGYSQGAMVIHRAVIRLHDDRKFGVMGQIEALVLVGDGDRVPDFRATVLHHGDRPTGEGIAAVFERNKPLPESIAVKTRYVCNKSDIVCDFSLPWTLRHAAHASDVHTHYSSYQLQEVGLVVASQAVGNRGLWTPSVHGRAKEVQTRDIDIKQWVYSPLRKYPYLALKTDGTVWGYEYDGEEYIGTMAYGLADVTQLLSIDSTLIARTADGKVWSWGSARGALLGNGTRDDSFVSVPHRVRGLDSVVNIDAGWDAVWATDSSGQLWVWGELSEMYQRHHRWYTTPHLITKISDVAEVADNGNAISVLKRDGTVWSWGCGNEGQTGDGDKLIHHTPKQVKGLPLISHIMSNEHNVFAGDASGGLWRWGDNWGNALGLGGRKPNYWHATLGGPGKVKALTVAWDGTTIALTTDGAVWLWGGARRLPERALFKNVVRLVDGNVVTRGWKP